MALTFDMGGRLDPAIDIMNFLIANEVCATLFPTGAMTETPTGQEVLAIVRDHPELFEVGNHTMHHCNLRDGGLGSPTEAPCQTGGPPDRGFILSELTDAAAIIASGSGQDSAPYWRPIAEGGPTAEQMATDVVTSASSGSIVLMHLGGYETLAALAIMVPALRERGLLLTSVSDLLN